LSLVGIVLFRRGPQSPVPASKPKGRPARPPRLKEPGGGDGDGGASDCLAGPAGGSVPGPGGPGCAPFPQPPPADPVHPTHGVRRPWVVHGGKQQIHFARQAREGGGGDSSRGGGVHIPHRRVVRLTPPSATPPEGAAPPWTAPSWVPPAEKIRAEEGCCQQRLREGGRGGGAEQERALGSGRARSGGGGGGNREGGGGGEARALLAWRTLPK